MSARRNINTRANRRVSPSRKLYGRVGSTGVLVVDLSERGARLEHYNKRFGTGERIRFQFEFEGTSLSLPAEVRHSRVVRFLPGEEGVTVYRSGIQFVAIDEANLSHVREVIATIVKRGLAEQVANVRGLGPVLQRDMPTFRTGVVDPGERDKGVRAEGAAHLVKNDSWSEEIGYYRCRRVGNRWEKKWTTSAEQPDEGFTIPANESPEEIELLCQTWETTDDAGREFIRACAQVAVDRTGG